MEADGNRTILCGGEILCIPCGDRIYAVEFSNLVEICCQIRISLIPCLPDRFLGVCNYKGTMLPVVSIGEDKEDARAAGKNIVAVVKSNGYQLGILTREEPFIVALDTAERIESPEGAGDGYGWCEKGMYRFEGGIFSVLDIDKTIEEMIVFR